MIFHKFLLTIINYCDKIKTLEVIFLIGKTLQDVLNEKGVNVNELSNMINVSNQTLYSIIKRDNMKIDFEVLLKICDALDVSVERFYSDFYHSNKNKVSLTNHENKVITAYRNKPDMQPAVDKLLGVEDEQSEIPSFRHPGELTKYKRQELGITQEELAQKLGVSVSELKQWEAYGSYINYNKISLLANILGIDALDLLPKNDGFFDSVKAADSKSFGNAFGSKNNK